jgi:hypothetical protein
LALVVEPAHVARADLGDCFTALAPVGQAAKAAEVGSTAAACLSAASGDAMMAMTIAAMTAAAVGGMFSTIDECNALVDNMLGQVIAAALLKLPLPLTSEQEDQLKQFANGNFPPGVTFREIIGAIPGLNAMPVYLSCGCSVAGAPGEFERIASEYKDSVEGCGDFFGDAKDAFFEWLGSGMESLFGGHDFVPGVQMETSCYVYEMPSEIWTAKYISSPSRRGCGATLCQPGHVVMERTLPSGEKQWKCSAECPAPANTFQPGGSCYGTDEYTVTDGRCYAAHKEECCAPGEKVETWGVCERRCPLGEFYDTRNQTCANCPPGQTNALTKCEVCPPGQIIWNFDKPGTPRPPGQFAIPGTPPPSQFTAPRSPAQRVAPVPPPSPSGSPSERSQTAIANPSGPIIATEPGKCVPCPTNWVPVFHGDSKKSSLGHCEECPRRSIASLGKCQPLNCPGGYDPDNPHTCLPVSRTSPVVPVIPGARPGPSTQRPGPGPATTAVPPPGDRRTAPPGTTIQRAPTTVPQSRTQQTPPAMIQRTPPVTIQRAPPAMRQAPSPCPPGLRFVNGQCIR